MRRATAAAIAVAFACVAYLAWADHPSSQWENLAVDNSITFGGETRTTWPTVGVTNNAWNGGDLPDNTTLNWGNFPSDILPIRSVDSLGSCPSSEYPYGSVLYLTTDNKLYICGSDNTWGQMVTPDFIFGAGNFPSDLQAVKLLDNLTACDNVTNRYGTVAYLIPEEKLYKCDTGGWSPVVASLGEVTLANFPINIRPVAITAALGTCGDNNYPTGSFAFLTTDNRLYRCVDNTWIYATPASDISGQLTSTQIGDNAIVTGKIAAGAVTAGSLAANSVTAGSIAANAVTAGTIAAGAISASTMFADGVVVSGKLAANAVTAGTVTANAITSDKLASNSVVAGKIAAGAINATNIIADGMVVQGKLGADAVIANNIAAGQIAASKISVSNLSSIHANMGSITAGTVTSSNYTPPGNNNSTAGVGMKLDATNGTIEAYGSTQSFGGPLVASDGEYMAVVGKYLTDTGAAIRYPLNNGTNFTADGRVHTYHWDGYSWRNMGGDISQYEGSSSASTIDFWSQSIPEGSAFMYEVTITAVISDGTYVGYGIWHKFYVGATNIGGTLYVAMSFSQGPFIGVQPASGLSSPFVTYSGTTLYARIYNTSNHTIKYQISIIKHSIAR